MLNKKGFTLIELLAVIVILAIIALISSPIIINLIENAREEAFKDTAYGIIGAGENLYAKELMKSNNFESIIFTYDDGIESSSISGKKLDYNGSGPRSGTVIINGNGKIAIAIHNGTWCTEKDYDETEIILSNKSMEECNIPTLYADGSGASIPEISDGMIPIKWDGTKWIKADINQEWYDYNAKEWANVVLVTESTRSAYQSATPGTEILETDVLAYLVWLPRYKYKLFNVNSLLIIERAIEIEFENKETLKSNGSSDGEWLTHPAFTFGEDELNGIWISKFRVTGNATTPTIKPNMLVLQNQNVSTQFATSKKFNSTTTYGLTIENDSHMLLNTEWGAVAYLSNSNYGKNAEIWMNPSFTTGKTGDAAIVDSLYIESGVLYSYTTPNGQQGSTTGNIYGIYDMSGGAFEYVMGCMYNSDGTTLMVGSSGFDQTTIDSPDMEKYINKYAYGTSSSQHSKRILGDATGETRAWYGDGVSVIFSTTPWYIRGDGYDNGGLAGIFAHHQYGGGAIGSTYASSFRIAVLSSNA